MMLFALLGVIVLFFAIIAAKKGKIKNVPADWFKKENYTYAVTLLGPVFLVAFTFWLLGTLFPETMEAYFARGGAYGTVFVCALVIGCILAFAPTHAMGKVAIGVLALVLFLGILKPLWSPTPEEQAQAQHQQALAQAQAVVPPAVQEACSGLKKKVTFGTQPVLVNPDGNCSGLLFYDEQNVTLYARRAGKTTTLGPFHRSDKLPNDSEYIWSGDKPIQGYIQLNPPKYTSLF